MANSNWSNLGCILILVCSGMIGCDQESRFPEPFYISSHPTVEVVDGPGRYVLDATCPSGRQLLGGAYYMPDGDAMLQIGVAANYPSSPDTWTAIFENPDNGRSHLYNGTVLLATAYCLATPDYPLSSVIVSAQGGESAGTQPFSIEARCPAGGVLTGGGFRTGISGPSFFTFNANLFVSAPTMNPAGQADGWQIGLAYLPQDVPPVTSVYALCARQNLVAGPMVVEELDLSTLATGWGWSEASAACPRNTFTTGGGYSFLGDLLIPRQVTSTRAENQFSEWSNVAAAGYQSAQSDFRPCDPAVDPDCAKTAALAACVEVPDIPFVKVSIVQPDDGDSFGSSQPGSTNSTPITFVAEATDEAGDPLTGNALQWFQDGMPFGTGESITATIPITPDAVVSVDIRVTATGTSTSASDQITIFVGTVE